MDVKQTRIEWCCGLFFASTRPNDQQQESRGEKEKKKEDDPAVRENYI